MNSRRIFLQKLGLSAITIPFIAANKKKSSDAGYQEPYQGPMLRVAIMGLGGYGTRVAEAMQSCKMARLTGLISGTPNTISPIRTVTIIKTSTSSKTIPIRRFII